MQLILTELLWCYCGANEVLLLSFYNFFVAIYLKIVIKKTMSVYNFLTSSVHY